MDGFQPVAVRISDEGRVISRAIVRSWPRRATIVSAGGQGSSMKPIHRITIWRIEGQVEPWTWRSRV